MSEKQRHWTTRKTGVIGVGTTQTLSLEQQQILASVPRWKREWVRPASLKPGQNPSFKVCKWVLDTSQGESEGTEEEMQAALKEVTAGNVPLPSSAPAAPRDPSATISLFNTPGATAAATASATPSTSLDGTPAPPAAPAVQPLTAAQLAASSNPVAAVQHANPNKPVAEQASTVKGGQAGVGEAVKGLGEVEMGGGVGTGGEVKQEERSLL
ncbi:hypothetical protein JCM8547_004005 [Rhodosporidiobolus lusitaniae]